ncbi:hypothetical protein [Nonomuraea typhae]|uniref:hypothetical protein n=1 Tax=Nonomuraea typhae TaxID=2603600 RepID=UPI0012FB7CE9|nr:hypothetical protein [Nonomuraea typhae]
MDKPPTNRWKVTVGSEVPKSFRSENKAYAFVREQLPHGHRIVVNQWENGRWLLYEVFEATAPDDSEGAAERRIADN